MRTRELAGSSLQQHLSAVWGHHHIAGENNVSVVAASAGSWWPLRGRQCTSPPLFFYIVGHYRTFAWTQSFYARVATLSGGSCAFVLAFVPDEVDASLELYTPGAVGRVARKELKTALERSPMGENVVARMRHAAQTTFSTDSAPAFAYAVVRRSGPVARYPSCLALYWHGVHALARWVADVHGFGLDATAVVVRSRPDVMLTRPIDVGMLRRYYAFGLHGRHLALGQAVKRASGSNYAQGDVHAIFSLGAYASDVVLPIEQASNRSLPLAVAKLWWQRGMASGWVQGRSADEWRWMAEQVHSPGGTAEGVAAPVAEAFEPQLAAGTVPISHVGGVALDNTTRAPPLIRCMDQCLCPEGSTQCHHPSCMLTVAQSIVVPTNPCRTSGVNYTTASHVQPSCVLRAPLFNLDHARAIMGESGEKLAMAARVDLAAEVTCYCAGGTTTARAAAASNHTLHCSTKAGNSQACAAQPPVSNMAAANQSLVPRKKGKWASFFRCAHTMPLVAEHHLAARPVGDAATPSLLLLGGDGGAAEIEEGVGGISAGSGGLSPDLGPLPRNGSAQQHHGAHGHAHVAVGLVGRRSLWPPGCGGGDDNYASDRQRIVPIESCV